MRHLRQFANRMTSPTRRCIRAEVLPTGQRHRCNRFLTACRRRSTSAQTNVKFATCAKKCTWTITRANFTNGDSACSRQRQYRRDRHRRADITSRPKPVTGMRYWAFTRSDRRTDRGRSDPSYVRLSNQSDRRVGQTVAEPPT